MTKVLALLLALTSFKAMAETVTFVSSSWPPYTGLELAHGGFTNEIIRQALEQTNLKSKFIYMPWRRAMESVKTGEIDALYSAYYSTERASTYIASEPYVYSDLMLATHSDSHISGYKTLADLSPYRIGVVRGYVNSPEFDQADFLQKEPVTNDKLNLKKLLGKRVDLIVIDRFVALHLLQSMGKSEKSIRFLAKPLDQKPVHIMFSRKNTLSAARVEAFNSGLKIIKQQGIYQEILKRYGFFVR